MRRPWKTTEERTLRETIEAGGTIKDAAALLGRDEEAVRVRAKSLGLSVDWSILARIRRQCDIDRDDPDSCWIWRGYMDKGGTPRINVNGSGATVLRTAMREAGMWQDKWRFARLTCGSTNCVRPEHGRGFDGARYIKNLYATGSLGTASHEAAKTALRRARAKLDPEKVKELRARRAAGEKVKDLLPDANGVCLDALSRAINGHTWTDVTLGASAFSWRPVPCYGHPPEKETKTRANTSSAGRKQAGSAPKRQAAVDSAGSIAA